MKVSIPLIKFYNFNNRGTHITSVCKGKRKTAGKSKWKYIDF